MGKTRILLFKSAASTLGKPYVQCNKHKTKH